MAWVEPVMNHHGDDPARPTSVEMVLAKDQPEYTPLPVAIIVRPDVPVVVRYRLSAEDLGKIMEGADICISQLTFGRGFNPINLQVVGQTEDPEPTEEVGK